ncbi:MAG: hypothetical protein J5929_06990 [Eubacterium sp.]|nr:hypothetical protein [Eubacterium sp.]
MKCINCGAEMPSGILFCTECGSELKEITVEKKEPSQLIFNYGDVKWIFDGSSIFGNGKVIKIKDIYSVNIDRSLKEYGTIIFGVQGRQELFKFSHEQDYEAQTIYEKVLESINNTNSLVARPPITTYRNNNQNVVPPLYVNQNYGDSNGSIIFSM